MAKKKNNEEFKRILVGIYPEEFSLVKEKIRNEGKELIGKILNSRDIRVFFGLKPTHRQGVKTELRKKISELSEEKQKEILQQLNKE